MKLISEHIILDSTLFGVVRVHEAPAFHLNPNTTFTVTLKSSPFVHTLQFSVSYDYEKTPVISLSNITLLDLILETDCGFGTI